MDLQLFFDNFDVIAAAPNGVKKLRELILQLAVRGKLVPQDPADEPAGKLLERIREEKESLVKGKKLKREEVSPVTANDMPYEIPSNWLWCRWNDVSLQIGDIDHKMPSETPDGIPYVSPRDFHGDNEINFDGAKKISVEDFENLRTKIQPRKYDIIFPRYGTIGENRYVLTDRDFLASYSCAIVKNFAGFIESRYCYYYSFSGLVKSEIQRYTNKTTQANVGVKSIKNFLFPLPPLEEQKRIVAKVDELMKLCDRLETQISQQRQQSIDLAEVAVRQVLDRG
jgi:type I restriction enzyme, S subunit